jgi:hypothetical protein
MSIIYVASSWRNNLQPAVVQLARSVGHKVYDFRNPPHGEGGFSWSDIDNGWEKWTTEEFRDALYHPISVAGFKSDMKGMVWAEMGILVLPCGRSSHVEAGWMQGMGMPVYVFSPGQHEPELMYKIFPAIISTWDELRISLLSYKTSDK